MFIAIGSHVYCWSESPLPVMFFTCLTLIGSHVWCESPFPVTWQTLHCVFFFHLPHSLSFFDYIRTPLDITLLQKLYISPCMRRFSYNISPWIKIHVCVLNAVSLTCVLIMFTDKLDDSTYTYTYYKLALISISSLID